MSWFKQLAAKLRCLFQRDRAERELTREVLAHLQLLEDEYTQRGLPIEEARLAARRAYGGVEQVKELHRAERPFLWLEQALQDARHALRSLLKNPGFTSIAIASLALGIGANTSIFTLVNGILLKTLPVRDPERIVQVTAKLDNFETAGFNYPAFRELRNQKAVFDDAIAFSARSGILELAGGPQRIDAQLVTGTFFSFFGARPALGRLLEDDDDRVEGARPVCVLSHHAWQSYFGGDPSVVGRTILVDGVRLEVVGVAGPDFTGPELQRRFDAWVPTAIAASFNQNARNTPTWVWLRILARLKSGIPFAEASARLQGVSRSIEDALPKQRANAGAVYRISEASRGFDSWRSRLRQPLLILMGAVVLVLLVACANLANLLLARANERQQEFAIKLSLGIHRGRLLRQLLFESLMLALAGGAAAVAVAHVLTAFLLRLFNAGTPYQTLHVSPDNAVLLFTLAACVLTAVIAGLYPAWHASRTDASPGLKQSQVHGRRSLVRRTLIVVQVALAVVLVFGSSLFAHSLLKLKTIPLGFDIDRVLTVDVAARGSGVKPATAPRALADVLTRVRQLPSVESAAWSFPGLLAGGSMVTTVAVTGADREKREVSGVHFAFAGPGYLSTMRIPLLRGRDLTQADRQGSQPVVIINEHLASRLWPGKDPLGAHFDGWNLKNVEVVGVIGNTKYQNVREPTKPIVIQSFDQMPVMGGTLVVRHRGPAGPVERNAREIVKSVALTYQVSKVSTMELLRDSLISQDRLLAFLSTLFGVLSTVLALVGVYGLISYSVTRRTREVGIRVSVGAQNRHLLWLFTREAATLIVAGIALGMPLALAASRLLRTLLYEISPLDPLSVAVTIACVASGGLVAALLPARRATRVDPVEALRYD